MFARSEPQSYTFGKPDAVTIHNTTAKALAAGVYILKKNIARSAAECKIIPAHAKIIFVRPQRAIGSKRILVVCSTKKDLPPSFTKEALRRVVTVNISFILGTHFYLFIKDDKLTGRNSIHWNLHRKKEEAKDKFISQTQHSKEKAMVRIGQNLCKEEELFVTKRLPLIKKHIEALFKTSLTDKEIPRIAFCCSGGGFRAMFATAGLLQGAKKIGLLDATLYLATLSGSSWFAAAWYTSGKDIETFSQEFFARGTNGLWRPSIEATSAFTQVLKGRYLFRQPISSIDWYGILLADKILGNSCQHPFKATLSALAHHTNLPRMPLLICTAAFSTPTHQYEWLEFSPFEVGSTYLDAHIPTWAFGRKFSAGISTDYAPEESLGYLLGIAGSSFSLSIRDLIDHIPDFTKHISKLTLYHKARQAAHYSSLANKKMFAAKIANFSAGLQGSPLHHREVLTLFDGGYTCNIPFDAALRRERSIDVIFFLDNQVEKASPGSRLRELADKAQARGYTFPAIDYQHAATQPFTVWRDPHDATSPTCIYIPLRKYAPYHPTFDPAQASFCRTFNFTYTPKEASLLAGLVEQILISHKSTIIKIIENAIERRRKR